MPIDYHIDHARRLVIARGRGTVNDADAFGYQREVWSRPDVCGYDELVDMTDAQQIVLPVPAKMRIQQLASEAAALDHPAQPARFAIVAPGALAYGVAREYQTHREMEACSTKQVGVFRTLAEALAFLGIEKLT